MAKTLGKLRQQTLKLRELEAPRDVSKGTKAFVKKHVYVVHPDANENGDDVFKATNVKKAKRSPDHGYEPGEDEEIYEGGYSDIDIKTKELEDEIKTHKRNYLKAGGPDGKVKGFGTTIEHWNKYVKAQQRLASLRKSLTNSYEYNGLSLKESKKLTPERHAAAWLAATSGKQRTRSSLGRHMGAAGFTHFDTTQFKKGQDIGYEQAKSNQDTLLRSVSLFGESYGKKDTTGYWPKSTLELGGKEAPQDPDQQTWMKTHPANKKIAGGMVPRPNVRRNSVIARDLAKMQANKALERNSYDPGEGYEHIAELSESDQNLLVNIYNSLDEANQDRFLEIAETEEGVDELLDFAIKQGIQESGPFNKNRVTGDPKRIKQMGKQDSRDYENNEKIRKKNIKAEISREGGRHRGNS